MSSKVEPVLFFEEEAVRCAICRDQRFSNPGDYMEHIVEKHKVQSHNRLYACIFRSKCATKAQDWTQMIDHYQRHLNIMRFVCPARDCFPDPKRPRISYGSTQWEAMQTHMKTKHRKVWTIEEATDPGRLLRNTGPRPKWWGYGCTQLQVPLKDVSTDGSVADTGAECPQAQDSDSAMSE